MTIRPPGLRDRRQLRGPYWPLAIALLALTSRPSHASLADEIHFTLMGQTAVTFDWRGGSDSLFYGLDASYGSFIVAGPPNVLPFSSPGPFREAAITGLTENTRYHYRIGSDGVDHTFHTPIPRGAASFRFVVQADVGAAKDFARVAPVQAMVAGVAPNLVFMIGDLTYANSVNITSVDAHFNDMMVWSQDAPYQPQWGNHEWETPSVDDLANYKGRFALMNQQTSPGAPTAPTSGCCGEDWYWFDYGCVRFISVPEPFTGAWNDWAVKVVPVFDAAQADPKIRYIVTFGHRPAYSTGYHPGESSLQTKMGALGASHSKYVLDLAGHSHDYERTYAQSGVVHVTAGTGGSALEPASGTCKWAGGCPPPIWDASRAMHHVVVYFDVGLTHITGTVLCGPADPVRNDISCTQGTVFDSFIVPGADRAPIVSAPAAVSGNEGADLTVDVQAGDPNGQSITSLTAAQLPPGATFTPAGDHLSGTLTWTPAAGQAGTYDVTFTASNALEGTAQTTLTVSSTNQAPTAALTVAPLTGNAPLSITANAGGTIDPEGQMDWYLFNFGDGGAAGPQAGSSANHTYLGGGEYDVTVTAADLAGLVSGTSQHVIVAVTPPGPNLTTNPSFEASSSGWAAYNGSTMTIVPGGFDGSQACSSTAGVASGSFGINDSPNWVASTSGAGARYRFNAWVRSEAATGDAKLRVTEFLGGTKIGSTTFSNPVTLSPQWKGLSLDFITGAAGSTLDLQVVDFPITTGETFVVDNVSIRDLTGVPVGVGDPGVTLEARSWVAPMPIVSEGELRFLTPRAGTVSVEIFDTSGRRLAQPINGTLDAGLHDLRLGGSAVRLRAGLYLYRIRHQGGVMQGRFVVAR